MAEATHGTGRGSAAQAAEAPGSAATASGGFFSDARPGRPGLAVFLNAGDPPLSALPELLAAAEENGVDCVELAVPFPDSVTDGPVIRRSAARALADGVTADDVLEAVASVRPTLERLRIALLADFSHTVKGIGLSRFTQDVADSGSDALLLHGLPPRMRAPYREAAAAARLPVVTTCYVTSTAEVRADAADSVDAAAYLYLVAHYGRSGTTAPLDEQRLAEVLAGLRARSAAPVAVGFGVRDAAGVARLEGLGAQAVVVGSAGVARIEQARAEHRDPVAEFVRFVNELRAPAVPGVRPAP